MTRKDYVAIAMERSISARELKAVTGAPTLMQATSVAYSRIEKRVWKHGDKQYRPAGMDWQKDRVLFFWSASAGPNCVAYKYRALPIADALDCLSGDLASAGAYGL